jgi:hypothetical protein
LRKDVFVVFMIYQTEIKTFAELSDQEIEDLKKVSKRNGSFREILDSLRNKKIQFPELIHLALAKKEDAILGWAMLDCSWEYNPKNPTPTMMVYVKYNFRRKKIGSTLAECLNRTVPFGKFSAYVWEKERERNFFKKIAKKIDKELEINNPKCYFSKQ